MMEVDGNGDSVANAPRWELQLRGAEEDLEHLARYFTSGKQHVFNAGPAFGYLIYAEDFDKCASSAEVLAAGTEHLSVISGVLRLVRRSTVALHAGAVYWHRADGLRNTFLHVSPIENLVQFGEASVVVTDCRGNAVHGPNSLPQTRKIADLAQYDSAVAKAMRLMVVPDANVWTGLARLTEVIEEDAGGWPVMEKKGWIDGKRRDLFRRTANSEGAGDLSRHGHKKFEQPPNPMTLDEAQTFVRDLIRLWIDAKVVT